MHGSHVEDYRRAPRGRLTTRYYGYNISDKSDEGQDALSQVEMGNPKYNWLVTMRRQIAIKGGFRHEKN